MPINANQFQRSCVVFCMGDGTRERRKQRPRSLVCQEAVQIGGKLCRYFPRDLLGMPKGQPQIEIEGIFICPVERERTTDSCRLRWDA